MLNYSNGECNAITLAFHLAMKEIFETKEIDILIKNTRGKERKYLKRMKDAFQNGRYLAEDYPISMVSEIESIALLKDVISYMPSRVQLCVEIKNYVNED